MPCPNNPAPPRSPNPEETIPPYVSVKPRQPGEWIEDLTLAQTRERLKYNVSTFEEMLQEKALTESGVHLYIDMKHTEIVRPVLHAVMQAVDRWGWTADRLVVATFRQLDLLQVRAIKIQRGQGEHFILPGCGASAGL